MRLSVFRYLDVVDPQPVVFGPVRVGGDHDAGLLGGSGDLDHVLRGIYVVGCGDFVAVYMRRALYGHLLVRIGRGCPCRFGLGRASVGDGSGTFDLDVVLFVVLSPRVVRLEVGRRVARDGDVGRPFADAGQFGRLDVARDGCGREQYGSGLAADPEALPAGVVGVGVVRAVGVAFPPGGPQFGRFDRTAVVGRTARVIEERVGGIAGFRILLEAATQFGSSGSMFAPIWAFETSGPNAW